MVEHVMLSKTYDPKKHKVTRWWWSEKLDGVRAWYSPKENKLFTRTYKEIVAPQKLLEELKSIGLPLDGELYTGRENFNETVSAVRKTTNHDDSDWENVKFIVFDAIIIKVPFKLRKESILKAVTGRNSKFITPITHHEVESLENLQVQFDQIIAKKGEGIMIINPDSMYEFKRSGNLLKMKSFHDCEVKVIEILPGTGKYEGMMGALRCQMAEGQIVKVGTGFDDAQRANPPVQPGDTITIKYFEINKGTGVPRFPVFLRKYC